jgi:hypothetical protein
MSSLKKQQKDLVSQMSHLETGQAQGCLTVNEKLVKVVKIT